MTPGELLDLVLKALERDLQLAAKGSAWATDLKILKRLVLSHKGEDGEKILQVIAKGRGLL